MGKHAPNGKKAGVFVRFVPLHALRAETGGLPLQK